MKQVVKPIYAETLPYWKTSGGGSDGWMDKAKREILRAGGLILGDGFGSEATTGRAAFMLAFRLASDEFKIIWPVLPSKGGEDGAARRQAATMLYHDVKARCISARALGARTAFFSYLLLSDGRTASALSAPELAEATPEMFGGRVLLTEGEDHADGH